MSFMFNENELKKQLSAIFNDDVICHTNTMIREYEKLMAYYRCAIMEVETKFNVLNEEFSLRLDRNPINSIKTRLKSMQSMREKLERKGIDYSISAVEENLNDVAGVRVICSFADDVYKLAEALLNQIGRAHV